MASFTIVEAKIARKNLYKERNYLQQCLGPEAPENVKCMLQQEIEKRNFLIDAIEAGTIRAEAEFTQKTITVPDDAAPYIQT